jgi:serine protease AprX
LLRRKINMKPVIFARSLRQRFVNALSTVLIALILLTHTPAVFAQTTTLTTLQSYLINLAATDPTDRVSVIVQKTNHTQKPEQVIQAHGGRITKDLTLINAFAANLPAALLPTLAATTGVRWIALDGPVHSVTASDGLVHVRDSFVLGSYANSDGDPRWAGAWNEVGETDGASAGDVAIVDFFGGALQGLRLQGSGKGAWRAVNLTDVTMATLMVNYRRKGFATETDAVALELSTDNGASWQTLDRLSGPATDPEIQTATYDLTGFVGGETMLRFVTAPTFTGDARFYLDSIEISMEPAAGSAPIAKAYLPLAAKMDPSTQSATDSVQAAASINLSNLASPYIRSIGADLVWNGTPNIQGDGVTVAVVDSGIAANSADLKTGATTSRIKTTVQIGAVSGLVDDYYGHGSQVAGVIAGNGAQSNGAYFGVAPNANLIDVKVTNDQGAGSTSDVIAGLQWIFTNRDTYNIKVVNLSLNSTVAESYHTSALNAAVEVLWFNKITVVVSAGNAGADKLFPPANDPFVITVGAMDDRGTTTISDDALAAYSAFGVTSDGFVKPDLVAPGHKIVGLLASDDTNLAQNYPDYKVTAATGARYFKMSGTSVASAVVAGAVALLLQDEPTLTPDQVKYRLMATATPLGSGSQNCATGAGYLNIYAAVNGATTQSANTNLAASQLLWSGADPVAWNSVSWNSVSWNSVSWNSVSWNSVSWNSVSRNSVSWNSTANDPNAVTTMGSCTGGTTGNAVTYLTLVNADTGQDIMAIGNGMVIDLSRLPTTNLNVRANVRGTVESVKFDFGGRYDAIIDNAVPYARFGNNGSAYSTENLANGSQTIIATPYQLDNAGGTAGNALAVEFTVINSAENKEFTSTLVAQHSSKCANVPGASTNLNVQWQQATCISGNSQAFAFKPVTNKLNTYTIVNRGNNLCMDVSGASQADAASMIQNSCTGALNQQFILRTTGASKGIFNLVAAHSGKCLDVNGSLLSDGAGLVQWGCTNTADQQWNLTGYVAVNQLANNGFTQLAPWYNTEGGAGLTGDAYNGNSAVTLLYAGGQSSLVQTGNALPNKQYVLKLYGKGSGGCNYGLGFYNKEGQISSSGSGSFMGATNYLPFQKTLTTPGGVTEFIVWMSRSSSTSFCYFDQISLETR